MIKEDRVWEVEVFPYWNIALTGAIKALACTQCRTKFRLFSAHAENRPRTYS